MQTEAEARSRAEDEGVKLKQEMKLMPNKMRSSRDQDGAGVEVSTR